MPFDLSKLARGDGAGVRVAIVDSGVQAEHPWVAGRLIESWATRETGDEQFAVDRVGPLDVVGHGTACAGQIRRYAPNADLISIRIFGETLKTTSDALLAALRWLVNIDVNLVNLSLSTQRIKLALEIGLAIDDLWERDVACICARGYHKTGRAYPTNFANTIAVTYTELIESDLIFRAKDLVEFDGPGISTKVAWMYDPAAEPGAPGEPGGPGEPGAERSITRVVDGSSYACPLVTGLAARMMSIDPTLTPYELKAALKKYAQARGKGWEEDWMREVEKDPVVGERV